jgi:hypothetical protein
MLDRRLGDGRGEHLGIEVWAYARHHLAIVERIRLRLAAQLMPFLHIGLVRSGGACCLQHLNKMMRRNLLLADPNSPAHG